MRVAIIMVFLCLCCACNTEIKIQEPVKTPPSIPEPSVPVPIAPVSTDISFESGGNLLSGVLHLPNEADINYPVVIFIHGDGAIDATSFSYYQPIFSALAQQGIASMSWSKAGVADSQGDWLDQNMEQRADEVRDAIQYLQARGHNNSIGLLGFSQAGWVIPYLSDEPSIDYAALVGGAVNWKDQSEYTAILRLLDSGVPESQIPDIIAWHDAEFELFYGSYQQYLQADHVHSSPYAYEPMSEPRFNFVQKNFLEDATDGLSQFEHAFLVLFGDSDSHVDIEDGQIRYQQLFASRPELYQQQVFENATHGLLRADLFLALGQGTAALIVLEVLAEQAFADQVLEELVSWVKQQSK